MARGVLFMAPKRFARRQGPAPNTVACFITVLELTCALYVYSESAHRRCGSVHVPR